MLKINKRLIITIFLLVFVFFMFVAIKESVKYINTKNNINIYKENLK